MRIIIEDTNIIIDLIDTGLYRFCDELGIEFHTTRYVVGEIIKPEQESLVLDMINKKKLYLDYFDGGELECLRSLIDECRGENNLTETDCSVLLLAKRLSCRLLTSDQKLKRKAEEYGIQVNGLLWLTDMMVDKGIVTEEDMIEYLTRYLKTNQSAPKNEIKKRIEKYCDLANNIGIDMLLI